jgi:hypothetical protein
MKNNEFDHMGSVIDVSLTLTKSLEEMKITPGEAIGALALAIVSICDAENISREKVDLVLEMNWRLHQAFKQYEANNAAEPD